MERSAKRAAVIGVTGLVAVGAVFLLSPQGGPEVHSGRSAVRLRPLPSTAPLPALPPPKGIQLGANVNRLFDDGTYSQPAIGAQLRALQATGASAARSDTLWEATEPAAPVNGAHRYDWGFDDRIATALAQHGLRWLPIIDYAPGWARAEPRLEHSPPRSAADYAAFSRAFAARYGRDGSFWRRHPGLPPRPVETYEIWNEPDNPQFWAPAPQAGRYAELYLRARAAIRSADPAARPIVGGLISADFVAAMLAAAPRMHGAIDGVGIHPYGAAPGAALAGIRTARLTLRSLGLGAVPLYATEFGWTIRPPGATGYLPEALRPRFIVATLAALGHTDCGLAGAFLYTWVTPERNPQDPEDWFGIHPPRGGSAEDTSAFARGIRAARLATPPDGVCALRR